MFDVKSIDLRGWGKTLKWGAFKRGLLINSASPADVRSGPHPLLVLVVCALLACLGVAWCAQALGIEMVPTDKAAASDAVGPVTGFLTQTLQAAISVEELHPNGWAAAVFVPILVVLVFALAVAVLVHGYSTTFKKRGAPSYVAWWLCMAGYLTLLAIISTAVACVYALVELIWPGVRHEINAAAWTFDLTMVFVAGWCLVLLRNRVPKQAPAALIFELLAMSPIFVLVLADFIALPRWAAAHEPQVRARAVEQCDPIARFCTMALALTDGSVLELDPRVTLTFDIGDQATPKNAPRVFARLHGTWLSEPAHEGVPVQLHNDQLNYARLRFDDQRSADVCSPGFSRRVSQPLQYKAPTIELSGRMLGKAGWSTATTITASIELPIPGVWAPPILASCERAQARSAAGAASPSSQASSGAGV